MKPRQALKYILDMENKLNGRRAKLSGHAGLTNRTDLVITSERTIINEKLKLLKEIRSVLVLENEPLLVN